MADFVQKANIKSAVRTLANPIENMASFDTIVQPYCKIQFVVDAGISQRQTAADYLKAMEEIGILKSEKVGREKLFSNPALLKLLKEP
jgi:predicted transcriptional regulator